MALQKTVTTSHGFVVDSAYHRVEEVIIQHKNQIEFYVRSYVSSDRPSFNWEMYQAPYEINGDNPIKQAYEHLKTLAEFADATDV